MTTLLVSMYYTHAFTIASRPSLRSSVYLRSLAKHSDLTSLNSPKPIDPNGKNQDQIRKATKFNRNSRYKPVKRKLRNTYRSEEGQNLSEFDKISHLASKGERDEAMLQLESYLSSMTEVIAINRATHNDVTRRRMNHLIKILGDGGYLDHCNEVLALMKIYKLKPSVATYSSLISRAGIWQNIKLAESYFREMKRQGINPDVQAYNALINAYAKSGQTDLAVDKLKEMEARDIEPTVITFNTLVDSCARSGNVEKALSFIEDMKARQLTPNERTYSIVMHAYHHAGKVKEVANIFRKMINEGLSPTQVTYSLLLHTLGQSGELDDAFKILEVMKYKHLKPNVVTLSSLIASCGKHQQLDKAFEIYDYMCREKDLDFRPNSITCSTLVDLCLKDGQIDRAFDMVREMRKNGIAMTEVTYTSLISRLTKLKQLDRISEIIQGESSEGIPPMRIAIKKNNNEAFFPLSAKNIFQDETQTSTENSNRINKKYDKDCDNVNQESTEDNDLQSQSELVVDALKSLSYMVKRKREAIIYAREPRELQNMFHLVLNAEAPTRNFEQLFVNLNDVSNTQEELLMEGEARDRFRVFGRYLYFKKCLKMVKTLIQDRSEEDRSRTLNQISEELSRVSEHSSTLKAFEWMKMRNIVPPTRIYNQLMKSSMKHEELFRLYLLFQDMRICDVRADTSTYNTLINACASVGDVEKALETLSAMQEDGMVPDVITYTSLIKACSRSSETTLSIAEDLFQNMQQRTNHFSQYVEPTEFTYCRLIECHMSQSNQETNFERIWELVDEAKEQNNKLSIYFYKTCVRVALHQQDMRKALLYLDEVKRLSVKEYDEKIWTQVIHACGQQGLKKEKHMLQQELFNRQK